MKGIDYMGMFIHDGFDEEVLIEDDHSMFMGGEFHESKDDDHSMFGGSDDDYHDDDYDHSMFDGSDD
jgi:hypothetical protein